MRTGGAWKAPSQVGGSHVYEQKVLLEKGMKHLHRDPSWLGRDQGPAGFPFTLGSDRDQPHDRGRKACGLSTSLSRG